MGWFEAVLKYIHARYVVYLFYYHIERFANTQTGVTGSLMTICISLKLLWYLMYKGQIFPCRCQDSVLSFSHTRAEIKYTFVGNRLRNFEIRVGNDGVEIGNNAICHKQLDSVESGVTKNFTCYPSRFGRWISVNKSETSHGMYALHFHEVRVYHGKYISLSFKLWPVWSGLFDWLIDARTKWLPFCRRYFQTHFLEWKISYFDWIFTEICSYRSDLQ